MFVVLAKKVHLIIFTKNSIFGLAKKFAMKFWGGNLILRGGEKKLNFALSNKILI